MEPPHSQTTAQPRSIADDTAHPSDASSFFEHDGTPTWKEKAGRFVKPWKRTKRVTNSDNTVNMNMDTAGAGHSGVTAPDAVHNNSRNDNETTPSASASSSRPSRRRRYIDGWVRYPKNSSSSSNPSSTSPTAPPSKIKDAYRIALKDRLVRKHLVICAVSGLLLLMLISLCMSFPPLFPHFRTNSQQTSSTP